jgi:hypothetical protein
MDIKEPIEKLLNTLGSQISKDLYGLDLKFKVVGKLEDSPNYSPQLMILIQTDKEVPNTLTVQNADWGYGKYATLEELQWNLRQLLKYIGINDQDVGIILNQSQLRTNDLPFPEEDDYIKYPERFTPLVDDTYVLDNNTGWVHYLDWNKKIDVDNAYHLSAIEEEEWWGNLSNEDKKKLQKLY